MVAKSNDLAVTAAEGPWTKKAKKNPADPRRPFDSGPLEEDGMKIRREEYLRTWKAEKSKDGSERTTAHVKE